MEEKKSLVWLFLTLLLKLSHKSKNKNISEEDRKSCKCWPWRPPAARKRFGVCLYQWISRFVKRPSVSKCCWGSVWRSPDRKQIGRRSAYQLWPVPSSLWHVLLVRSLKASLCFPRHTPPQYPWLKCHWRSHCRSQVGHTAFVLGHAHYSDHSASATAARSST